MFIKIEQTQSSFKNKFEIYFDGELEYLAGTPWMKLSLPFDLEDKRDNVMTDASGNPEFVSHWMEKVPFEALAKQVKNLGKLLTGDVQTGYVTAIFDKEQNLAGRFYSTVQGVGIADNREIIEWGEEKITGFDKGSGRSRHVSFYIDKTQIGQLVKPLKVTNNLDIYYLFILDEYIRFAKILSFYTVYFDRRYYSRSGEIAVAKKENRLLYTEDKNEKHYNPSWIRRNFDLERIAPEYIPLDESNKKFDSPKGYFIVLGAAFGVFVLAILIIWGVFSYIQWVGGSQLEGQDLFMVRLIIMLISGFRLFIFIFALIHGVKKANRYKKEN